jgi:hemoglobin/transferrin/lactoferrin receptor protein
MKKTPLLVVACLGPLACAETPGESMRRSILDEVVVTPTRTEKTIFDAPYTAHAVKRDDFIGRRWVRTLPDALQETPGVMVQRTGYGQASPFIRGFTGFRTLALIDGIRLNNATFREGPNQYWSTIDQYSIERLDVVKGPSSVLYGSDAIGGTVNAITRKPRLLSLDTEPSKTVKPADGKAIGLSLGGSGAELSGAGYYRYATAEDSHTTRGEFNLALSPRLGIAGGVTWRDFDDLRGGDLIGRQNESGYGEITGDFSVLWRPAENVEVTLGFQRFEQNNAPRWHSTIYSKSFDGTAVGTDRRRDFDQLRELGYLRVEARDITDWLSRATLTLSGHRQAEEQERIRPDRRRDVDGFRDDQYGVLLNLESPTAAGLFSYGVEYYHDDVQSWGTRWRANGTFQSIQPRGQVADDSAYDLLGIYVQDDIRIGEKLTLIPGARWTWARADTGIIDPDRTDATNLTGSTQSYEAFTFSLRAKCDMTRQWNLFTGLSQGFRAPNLSDLTSFDIARSGERETPSPGLDPEHYLAFEIGTKVSTENLDFYSAFYRTWIDNQIVRFPTGRTIAGEPEVQRANLGGGCVQGVEAGAAWRFAPGWTAFGNFAWAEGESDQFGPNGPGVFPISRIQPLTGQLGLHWESANGKWWAEALVTLARIQDRRSPGDVSDTQRIPPGGTRGYHVYTLRAGWRPCECLDLFIACENLTDEDYRIHGSGINEPGRNFVFGSKVAF